MAEPTAYGGFWIRFLAYLVDMVIIMTACVAFAIGATALGDIAGLLTVPVFGLGPLLYIVLMQASPRQATLGKMLLGLKVTTVDGARMSVLRSLGRELAKIVSGIPMMIGFLLAAFTGRKQALHDMIASTVVVRESPGRLLVGFAVGVFGWVAPMGLAMAWGLGVAASMMGVDIAGVLQEASKQPPPKPAPTVQAKAAPPAQPPKPAPVATASPKPAPAPAEAPAVVSGAVKLHRMQLYQPESETSDRLGGDASSLARYAKAIEQRFVAVGASLKGTPRTFGVAVIVKPDGAARSWLIPAPGEDREVAALYRTLEADVAGIPAPEPKEGPIGFALVFSVHGGQPERGSAAPMPPSWVSITRSEQPANFDALAQAVWPDPRATTVAKVAPQPLTVAIAPEPQAKPSEEPAPRVVEVARAEEPVVVPIPPGPVRPGPKYNDLMTAVLYADADAVGQLLKLGRWPDKPDSRGTTPLAAAAMLGDVKSAELLLQAGADPAPALAVARERGDGRMTALLRNYIK
jgi:uncharacterized RDD family membrane protein YckC